MDCEKDREGGLYGERGRGAVRGGGGGAVT